MSTSGAPTELLRDRVRLYVQVLLVIDLVAYASDLVTPLLIEGAEPSALPYPAVYWRWTVTAALVACWSITKFAAPSRTQLILFESGITLGLAVLYAILSLSFADQSSVTTGVAFSVIGVVLLLVVRSALVPSPVLRTALVGVASFSFAFGVMREALTELHATTLEGLVFMGGAFVLATSVTSHVIYGLRRQVRDAMRLGQYHLEEKIGEGGMGLVYRATHHMLRRPTAVKLLPTDEAAATSVIRFEREVRQTSRLEHPNSVRIYDYGRSPEGQFYYAMEYLDGVTLQQLVAQHGPLGEARTAHVLVQAAHALAEAHEIGLVHRDVKPANIMLCDRGRVPDMVKVLDFGLVKVTGDDEGEGEVTRAGAVLGTPQYMAPEAITDPDRVGPPSDVYALGAVGFFLLTGRQVFSGRTIVEVCAKHLNDAPPVPSEVLGRAVDPALERLILSCLAKDPAQRPADGAALAELIEALDLPGWSPNDARAWWQGFEKDRVAPPGGTIEPTEFTVDVGGRD